MKKALTHKFHQLSAATGDLPQSAAIAPVGLLDVPSSTPPRPSGRNHHISRQLTGLATKAGGICGLMIIAVLAVAGPLVANDFDLPPGKWWEDQRLVSRVGLADEQQDQIREVVYQHARLMIGLKADVDKAGLDLAGTVDQQDFDPVPVRAAYAVYQTARQKLENERFEMLLEVRQILTYEQWQKIEEIKRRMKQNRSQQQRRPGARGQGPRGDRPPGY